MDLTDDVPRRAAGSRESAGRKHLRLAAQLSLRLAQSGPEMGSVLDVATSELAAGIGDSAVIALIDPSGQWLEPVSFHHRDPAGHQVLKRVLTGTPIKVGEGLAGSVAATGEPIRLADLSCEWAQGLVDPAYHDYVERLGLRSVAIVPLPGATRILGTLGMTRETSYDSADEDLLMDLAGRVALSLEHAARYANLAAATEQLARERDRDKQERDLLQRIADQLPALVSYWDRDLGNRFANAAYADFLGVHPQDIIGKHVKDVLGAELFAANQPFIERALDGTPQTFDREIQDAAGQPRHTQIQYLPDRQDGHVCGLLVMVTDVTARRRVELALRAAEAAARGSEARYRLLADNAFDVVVRIHDGVMTWVSPSLTRQLGWDPAEWVGHRLEDFQLLSDPGWTPDRMRAFDDGSSVARVRIRAKDASPHWVETHNREVRDDQGRSDGSVTTFRTVDDEVRSESAMARRAKYDDLTGLLQRDEAMRLLASGALAAQGAADAEGAPTRALLFCDVDDLKGINDAHGHTWGDQLLRRVAARIRSCVRGTDVVARVGGDEFLVVLDRVGDLAGAVEVAEKIRRTVNLPDPLGGHFLGATVSIGVTLAGSGEPIDAVINRADRAMYRAKRAGRNTVVQIPGP